MAATIIIFNSLKANLIFYGGAIFLIVLWIIFKPLIDKAKENNKEAQNIKVNTYNYKAENNRPYLIVDNQRELDNLLISSYYQLENQIKIKANYYITAEDIIKILSNKKTFIFNNSFSCRTRSIDNKTKITEIDLTVNYTQGFKVFRAILDHRLINKLDRQDLLVYNKIKEIFAKIINLDMNDFQKVLAVHDYLILTSRYDYDNYKNGTIPDISHTPYGLLFKKLAVCSSYAEVFMIFMTLANIESYFVIGNLKESNNTNYSREYGHAWNIVKIESNYYHVDVTLDNPVPDIIGLVNYKYLNVSDAVLEKTHSWNRSEYPVCNSMKYNYFNISN